MFLSPIPAQRGIALVIVLAFLVLLSALVIAFFSSVQTDLTGSKTYARGVTARQLAETATNVVIGQISDATKSYLVPGDTASTRLTWASQPGLIHTYGDDGKPGRSFKLYSSTNMVEDAGTDFLPIKQLDTEVPDTWPAAPALFSDLNSPVLVPEAAGRINVDGKTYTANYPILDPLALFNPSTQMGVEGFSIKSAKGFPTANWTPNESYNPTVPSAANKTGNPAPMPVRWLYVLRDGTLTAPDPTGTTTATWTSAPAGLKPSQDNPIVGRIAFWADDETCKLNINTASEGVFWDRAFARSSSGGASPFTEDELNKRVPTRGEFYRYPGHPATVSLSPVFGGLTATMTVPTGDNLSSGDFSNYYKAYYDIAPRVTEGGSYGGTNETFKQVDVAYDSDVNRLYSSVDELLFDPPEGTGRSTPSASPTRAANANMTRSTLEKAKFFLTAYNRAPEVNAFGRPRISLWPLQQMADPGGGAGGAPARPRNARDELLAYCATANNFPFYLQRYSAYQPQNNNNGAFNQNPPPSSQHPTEDWEMISRNQLLYSYLQNLTDQPMPGWGTRITTKYPNMVRNQILTEMFDLVRSGINTYAIDKALSPQYFYAPARTPAAAPGETSVVSLAPTTGAAAGTKGFGRFPTVTEAALVFYATAAASGKATEMRAAFVLQPYTPMAGLWTYSPLIHYKVKGLDQFAIAGQPAVFRRELDNLVTSRCGYGSGGAHHLPFTGLLASFRRWAGPGSDQNKAIPASPAANTLPEENYNLISDTIPVSGDTFTFTGGEITIEIYAGYGTTTTTPPASMLVQTLKMKFPDASTAGWPVPRDGGGANEFASRIPNIFNAADTVRSVQVDPGGPSKGDLRVICALPVVSAEYFAPFSGSAGVPGYADSTARAVFSMRNGEGAATGASIHGDLLAAGSIGNPILARGTKGALLSTGQQGDFDNGAYDREDGALTNKPDDYFGSDGSGDRLGSEIVSPNRQVCSPVMFGSLSSGVDPTAAPTAVQKPWQTLLFCAHPGAGKNHPGFQTIRDHVFLDFWTMPVVEPYAISEPFSTAGKVNLNYQIAPFTYITRSTALRGVLKSTRMMAIGNGVNRKSGGSTVFRREIDRDETLQGFETRFATTSASGAYNGDTGMFRLASEICDMSLVPTGSTLSAITSFWNANNQTGDNTREGPYGQIYARVTTKSNTYTVHMRVQVLRKRTTTDPAAWVEGQDQVASEYRGSSTVERYIDPGDTSLKDFAKDPKLSMDDYYKFRIVSTRKFAP